MLFFLFVAAVAAVSIAPRTLPTKAWADAGFTSLVTFGDSYTDEQRISYFINHNGTAPPVGWVEPVVSVQIF